MINTRIFLRVERKRVLLLTNKLTLIMLASNDSYFYLFFEQVIRILLLWVNNHFNDFERSWNMMRLLEEFEYKLNDRNLQGQTKLLNIACTTKAKPRVVILVSYRIFAKCIAFN